VVKALALTELDSGAAAAETTSMQKQLRLANGQMRGPYFLYPVVCEI
jgi:hypothetical protein